MSPDRFSLDRLHDIVMPDPVRWWPPAPGWCVLIAIVLALCIWLALRAWRKWRANAYRRQALRELESAGDVPQIAAILRRTALAMAPRTEIAGLTGDAWVDWLDQHAPLKAGEGARRQLAWDLYAGAGAAKDDGGLRDFAVRWIRRHHARGRTESPC